MSTAHHKLGGFSLIELLIVISMVGLFAGLALPYFQDKTNELKLDKQTDYIITALELSKSKAAAGDQMQYTQSCTELTAYQFNLNISAVPPTAYSSLCCDGSCSYTAASYELDQSLEYQVTGSPTILFTTPKLGTDLAADTVIQVRNPSSQTCYQITVNQIGVINRSERLSCP